MQPPGSLAVYQRQILLAVLPSFADPDCTVRRQLWRPCVLACHPLPTPILQAGLCCRATTRSTSQSLLHTDGWVGVDVRPVLISAVFGDVMTGYM